MKTEYGFIDDNGIFVVNDNGICELLLRNEDISEILCEKSDKSIKFNNMLSFHNKDSEKIKIYENKTESLEDFHKIRKNRWFIPEKYKNIDVLDYIISKCKYNYEIERIDEEYKIFYEQNMIDLLRIMIYISDVVNENNIFLGIGRGSSVSSYILYKLGIHKVDSIKYNLDYNEFFKTRKDI